MPAKRFEPQPELAIEDEDEDGEEDGEEEGEEEEVGDETDEELHPLRTTAPSEEAVEDLLAVPLTQCLGWRGLASDGAVLLEALLPGRVALEASKSCQRLRDEECMSYMFSNPASQMAPPCGAEAIFLDDKALAQAGTALLQALRKLREAVAALGEGQLVCAGLPMVSCGALAAMVERPHLGIDGAPAGTSPGTGRLALTAVLFLDDVADAPADLAGVDAAAWVQRPDCGAAACKGAKRARREKAAGGAWLSVTPAAGQCLLLAPGAVRRLRGGRVSLTTWWWHRPPPARGTCTPLPPPLPPPLVFDAVLTQAAREQLAQLGPARWAVYDRRAPARNAQARATARPDPSPTPLSSLALALWPWP